MSVENKLALLLHEAWMAGETYDQMAKRFGVSSSTIHVWSRRYKLPRRPKPMPHRSVDPTPEEIERLKAECRERHYAQRRSESDDTSRIKARRNPGGV